MFKRWEKLSENKSNLIIGPRRAGKTTLLRLLYPDMAYLTLDDLDLFNWAQQDTKGFVAHLDNSAIIDEIQRYPLLTVALKYAIDNNNARFLMTGSSTIGLLDAAADTLAGRVNIVSLPTCCWGENHGEPVHSIFHDKLNLLQIKEANRKLKEAIKYGQFPEVLEAGTNEEKQNILINYRNTYFTRDLMQLSNIENLEGLLAVFHHIHRSLGSHLEVSAFAREAGLSFPTAKKYLNALNQAQLTFKLYGYQFGPAKRHIKAAKTYWADTGIINSFNTRLNEGQLLENFVIGELEKRRKLGFIKTEQFFYYKSAGGHEIDLLFETDGIVYAIEIKNTARPGPKDFRNLRQFKEQSDHSVKCFLFYTGEEYRQENSIELIPVSALYRGV